MSIILDDDAHTGDEPSAELSIKEAKDNKNDTNEVAHNQLHLTAEKQSDLAKLLIAQQPAWILLTSQITPFSVSVTHQEIFHEEF